MLDIIIYNAKIVPLVNTSIIETGYITIKDGIIQTVESGKPLNTTAKQIIDAKGMYVLPSLVDCHTHLMEYATGELHKTQGKAQKMAGIANLLTALKSGITMVGEHHLGHPVFTQNMEEYKEICIGLPLDVKLSFGCCILGTEQLTTVASTRPGQVMNKDNLTMKEYNIMAAYSDFAGENIFLNATVANLPLELAPKAGEVTYDSNELREIIKVFHANGKKIGAHIEGTKTAKMFIEAGGDIIHHGHDMNPDIAPLMSESGVALVITPHAGTSSKPTSPDEIYHFYKNRVKIALATDSLIPVHPEADWINVPKNHLIGPQDFLTIAQPVFKYFLNKGIPIPEILKLITINGREILNSKESGYLIPGNLADMIISDEIPGIHTTSIESIKYVIKNGEIVIAR